MMEREKDKTPALTRIRKKAEIGNTQNRKEKKSEIEQAKELYPEKKTTPRTPTKGDEK